MDLRSNLSHFKPDNCLEANLMRAFIKGEATQEEWAMGVAVSEASRAMNVNPRPYPQLPQAVRSYCHGRAEGNMHYDYALAKRLGEWFEAVQRTLDFNSERLDHYAWAAALTQGQATIDAHRILCHARDRFAFVRLPDDELRLCLHVKRLDADARIRNHKGGA